MDTISDLEKRINHITKEISEMRKVILKFGEVDRRKTEEAWQDLMKASDEISTKWKGMSALEEIQDQREKNW